MLCHSLSFKIEKDEPWKKNEYKLDKFSNILICSFSCYGFLKDLDFKKLSTFVENLGLTKISGGWVSCWLRNYDTMCTEIDM